ncbi:hypothetical protein COY93_03750 [Candidatus Uhrbacteria bacterium CG_4_10_14_0_8_um_filter_58_22]|uniref:Glycosyltransferase RgtA/B/C/D-like domain-containing protein n=1 Tax=Candidatus Uhrbacteria bacterium CG_4_10_14_0_8_um_filter_58_22 TaxID=1975029 RepID=A0A2M7QAB8_9BACT|nr:MAG: hypothetical protein AUJ19_00965 [Parcubacteria group bacterium CG1_02_58_44]PIY62162.1 MAG: hypothetical protein COY93_03750 [Candidatus Uhrbacteria bacterium CG_4_10_14_0_8_um_filter_58_22]
MTLLRKNLLLTVSGLALAVIFFFAYSFLGLSVPNVYNSPDENANAVFARQFAADGRLYRVDELNLRTGLEGLVHPRSVRVVGGFQVPGGFLGLPVMFGLAIRVFGSASLPFVTPVLALLGALAWGCLLGWLFGRRVGMFGGLLLLVNPVWWYWAARSLMPNVAFCSLLLLAVTFVVWAPFFRVAERRCRDGWRLLRQADGALAGMFLGLALAVRPVELYWIVLAVMVLAVVYRRSIPWSRVAVAGAFCLLTLAPFLILNQSLYGHWLMSGYGDVGVGVSETTQGGLGARLLGPLRPWLFPLGFVPRLALANFWTYGVKFFWWWSALSVLSGAYLLLRRRNRTCSVERSRRIRSFLIVAAAVTGWLILFYGSWPVQDNPDPSAVTVGSSYLRYWLPTFVLSTAPLAAAFDCLLSRRFSWWRSAAVWTMLLATAVVSAAAVFGSAQEGLSAVRSSLVGYRSDVRTVLSLTGSDALIIVDRADKTIYPYRSVISPLRSEQTYEALPVAAAARPLYYYGLTFPLKDLDWFRANRLVPHGLDMEAVQELGQNTLYRIFRTYSAGGTD